MTGDELVVVAFGASKGLGPLLGGRPTTYGQLTGRGWSTSGSSSAPPLFDPVSWVGLTGALLRRHTWWPCQTAGMGASGDGWLWGPGCVTGPDDEVH